MSLSLCLFWCEDVVWRCMICVMWIRCIWCKIMDDYERIWLIYSSSPRSLADLSWSLKFTFSSSFFSSSSANLSLPVDLRLALKSAPDCSNFSSLANLYKAYRLNQISSFNSNITLIITLTCSESCWPSSKLA